MNEFVETGTVAWRTDWFSWQIKSIQHQPEEWSRYFPFILLGLHLLVLGNMLGNVLDILAWSFCFSWRRKGWPDIHSRSCCHPSPDLDQQRKRRGWLKCFSVVVWMLSRVKQDFGKGKEYGKDVRTEYTQGIHRYQPEHLLPALFISLHQERVCSSRAFKWAGTSADFRKPDEKDFVMVETYKRPWNAGW